MASPSSPSTPSSPNPPSLPPVVLAHGFGSSGAETWGDLGWIDLLVEAGRDVHAIDILGHGGAPKPHDPAAYARLDHWLADHLPAGPLDAIGFSLGGRLLLGAAALRPELFGRLVIAGVGDTFVEGARGFRPKGHQARIAEVLRAPAAPENPSLRSYYSLAASPGADREALIACLEGYDPMITAELLAAVTCPVLVVIGAGDEFGPARGLTAGLATAELVTLPRTDHQSTPKHLGFIDAALRWIARPA